MLLLKTISNGAEDKMLEIHVRSIMVCILDNKWM